MKKIIIGFLSFAFLFVGQSALAVSVWNRASNDCPTVSIANMDTGIGYGSPCWNGSSISAEEGQSIKVRIYYHNSSDISGFPMKATNVRIVLNQPTGSYTSKTFSGQIISDQGTLPFGPVTVSIPAGETLSFVNTLWYPNQETQNPSGLLSGQNGSEIMNGSGLYLGTINSGWQSQGSVAVIFSVSNTVTPQPTDNCTISNFTINGSSSTTIDEGDSATLRWNTDGCDYVTVSGPNSFYDTSADDVRTVYPDNSGTYTLTARGNYGSTIVRTVRVYVDQAQDYYYCTISNFTANGSTSLTIPAGQAVTLAWNTNDCTSVTVSGPTGTLSTTGNGSNRVTVYPQLGTNTYTINAYGSNGYTPTQYVYVSVNQVQPPQPPQPPIIYTNTCAVTTLATNVGQTQASLNGMITNSGYATNAYFEYGTTVNLGSRTPSRSVVGNTNFSEVLSGLAPDTIYFFRLVGECQGGISTGTVEIFHTAHDGRVTIIQGTTVAGTASPIMLKIEDRFESIGTGDTIDYAITYKNIGKTTLKNPVLQVIVPKDITLTNASRGTYSADTNTLTAPLDELLPNTGGIIYVQGHVDSIPSGTARIVSTAVLVYTNPSGAQENAIAYVLNRPKDSNNSLGAAALFGSLGQLGLIGWLLLVALIMGLVLLARTLFARQASTPHSTSH